MELTEGLYFRPTLLVDLGHDDNLLNRGGDSVSSTFLRVEPDLWFAVGGRISHIKAHYRLGSGTYFDSSDDNYTDHVAELMGHHEFTAQHRIDAEYRFKKGHEARGTGVAEFEELNAPLEYTRNRLEGKYEFGADSARMQLGVMAGYLDHTYDNFRDLTEARDYEDLYYGGDIKWRVGNRSALVVEAKYTDRDYPNPEPDRALRDSTTLRALAGVTWDVTDKTQGRAKFGIEDKDFDDSSREDFSGFSWDIGLTWNPRTYSTIEFESSRAATDPFSDGDYVNESIYDATWTHYWRSRFATVLGYRFENDDYTGDDREDDIDRLYLGVVYEFRRWLKFEPYYQFIDHSSTRPDLAINYDKTLYGLSVTVSL
ncbi:outer membrane beta-barrel protein [Ferrimonas marina]|nr:outer membrane beta-barrel protein [Ferrimonas marina]